MEIAKPQYDSHPLFPILGLLALALFFGSLIPYHPLPSKNTDQTAQALGALPLTPPSTLLTENLLKQSYIGAIRTPTERSSLVNTDNTLAVDGRTMDGMNYSGGPFAIDSARNEFVFGTRYSRIVRLKMVEPKVATTKTVNGQQALDPASYPVAPYVDSVILDYSNGTWREISDAEGTGYQMAGFLPKGDKLFVMGNIYYDANNNLRRSIFSAEWPVTTVRPVARSNWKTIGSPLKRIDANGNPMLDDSGNPISIPPERLQGNIAGPMAPIPAKWQSALKGDILSAQPSGLPIITRQCQGPCAFTYWSNDVLTKEQPPATLALGYVDGHPMPGHPWGNAAASEYYNAATAITGMAIVEDDIIFVGYHGYGPYCYGKGTDDQSLHGTTDPADGGHWCYDPSLSSKGTHAFPYRAQAWVYPVSVMVDIIEGRRLPWDVLPTIVKLDWLPIFPHQYYQNSHPLLQPLGVAYHEASKRLYIGVRAQDGYGYEPGPLIHAFNMGGEAPAYPTPYPTPYATPPQAPTPTTPAPNQPDSSDTTAPSITDIAVTATYKSARVTWATSEAASGQIDYGASMSYGQQTQLNPVPVTTHTEFITGLNPGTVYHYRIRSSDSSNNLATSSNRTFTTLSRLAKPPKPPGTLTFTSGSINLAWASIDYELCSAIKIYRDTGSAPQTPTESKLIATLSCSATSHHDANVTPGVTYYYSIFVFDDLGIPSDPLSGSFAAPEEENIQEAAGGEPVENSLVSSRSSSGGGGGGGASTLTEEAKRSMIINIMTQLIALLTQLIIQMKLQAANVISAISNWGL